jgi:hypothetical protein
MLTVYPSEIAPMDITPLNNKPIHINLSAIYKTLEMIKKRNYVQFPVIYYAPHTTYISLQKPSLHNILNNKPALEKSENLIRIEDNKQNLKIITSTLKTV